MKRYIAGLVGAVVLASAAATPAQAAAPADPVKALKSQMAAGKGVKSTDVMSFVELAGKTAFLRRTGVLQYGKPVKGGMGDIYAADINADYTQHDGPVFKTIGISLADEHTISIGKISYVKGEMPKPLPKGKSWLKVRAPMPGGSSSIYCQQPNPAEPATLQALIKGGQKTGRTYKGSISKAQLWQVSPWYRAATLLKDNDGALDYELTLGPDNLPQRLLTTFPATEILGVTLAGDDVFTIETRFTGWGSKVRVTPPPAGQVYPPKKRSDD